jgi:hypothetical protein
MLAAKIWTRFLIPAHEIDGQRSDQDNNDEEEAINKYIQEEIEMKVEPNLFHWEQIQEILWCLSVTIIHQ